MIINCENCNKKFEVNSSLIPKTGRTIQCGICNHKWFFKLEKISTPKINEFLSKPEFKDTISISNNNQINKNNADVSPKNIIKSIKTKKDSTKNLKLTTILSYIIVLILSFVGVIIFLDTFKSPLQNIFPNLELFLFNLFETLKDIFLFTKNLIN
jgi:predicted Zn finger-like uncharacterized protein